jgi:hypothetical protein
MKVLLVTAEGILMNLKNRLSKIEDQSLERQNAAVLADIANLQQAQGYAAAALKLVTDIAPLNSDWDHSAMSDETLLRELHDNFLGAFVKIHSLLAERGISTGWNPEYDGKFKPSHLNAFISVLPEEEGYDEHEDHVDLKKFQALTPIAQQKVKEALQFMTESGNYGQPTEEEKRILGGTV